MRRILFVFLCLSLCSLPLGALAAPFLVCDPTPEVLTGYEVEFNGQLVQTDATELPDGTFMLKYDLSPLVDGQYTAVARACNMWGCSGNSDPFDFNKAAPLAPAGITLSAE